jgi:hypothetical protein
MLCAQSSPLDGPNAIAKHDSHNCRPKNTGRRPKKYGSSGSTGASGPYKAKFTAGYPKIDLFVQKQLTILLLERRTD